MRGPLHSYTFQDFLTIAIGPKNKRTYRYVAVEKSPGNHYDSMVYDDLANVAKYELMSISSAMKIVHLCNVDEEIYLRQLFSYLK